MISFIHIHQAFVFYEKIEKTPLTPEVAFASLALFQMLNSPLLVLPNAVISLINALVSIRRILRYLTAPEVEKDDVEEDAWKEGYSESCNEEAAVSIKVVEIYSVKHEGGDEWFLIWEGKSGWKVEVGVVYFFKFI